VEGERRGKLSRYCSGGKILISDLRFYKINTYFILYLSHMGFWFFRSAEVRKKEKFYLIIFRYQIIVIFSYQVEQP